MLSLAEKEVDLMYSKVRNVIYRTDVISERMIKKYINLLSTGTSPGKDGITTEHLKYAMNSKIINYLSELLSICIKFGIVPECFNTGLLIPILKKSTLDPQIPKNYRPITISSTFSKILELYILDVSSRHEFSDLQFGFIAGRGTNMAASLANDVISYCNKRGSAVFTCSLDAEGAFDTVPHNILLYKSIGILPDHYWRILFN